MRRPLHVVGVAHGGRWVEVSLNCPPQHELARLLCDLSKIDERVVGGFVSGFFPELSPSHRYELLTGLNLALGNRPVAHVLLDPERSALMGQEHLQAALPAAPEQDAGTRAPRFVGRHTYLLARVSLELSPAAWVKRNRRALPRQGLERSSCRCGRRAWQAHRSGTSPRAGAGQPPAKRGQARGCVGPGCDR